MNLLRAPELATTVFFASNLLRTDMRRMAKICSLNLVVVLLLLMSGNSIAAGRGDGGCVLNPGTPIYKHSQGTEQIALAGLGDCVVGMTIRAGGLFGREFTFENVNGRLRVTFLPGPQSNESGSPSIGYMNPSDLSSFTYECGCGSLATDKQECSPFSVVSLFPLKQIYNACYREARDRKRAEVLAKRSSVTQAIQSESGPAVATDAALRNEDVLSLVKVGLDQALIVTKIQTATKVNFDLSTDALIVLKNSAVPNSVIEAMMKRSTGH